ncbi:MAG: hypothetical protein E6860_15770 [Clostridium sp.]|uniref:hypothetical protein n=1 Tax=Clostridium sp. TaxID=1506 RepID=UPI002904FAF5|nr:hypothetical protein [Clostridium sp.]MDU1586993.1 hypothetical protein [Clostridium sp.]
MNLFINAIQILVGIVLVEALLLSFVSISLNDKPSIVDVIKMLGILGIMALIFYDALP